MTCTGDPTIPRPENPDFWPALAVRLGWRLVAVDPAPGGTRVLDGPLLWHPELDRVWPMDDPEGAVHDVAPGLIDKRKENHT